MHRSPAMTMRMLQRQLVSHRSRTPVASPCDAFINHRGVDTKRTVASLLYDHLARLNLRPFLDNKNMRPGDKLFEKIDCAIRGCKIGVAVLSPRYCESYFCLHELALIMESKKKVIPIFCDVKPSELRVKPSELRAVDGGHISPMEVQRFSSALEEAKYTVGLTFDSLKGNLADVVTSAADIVIDSLIEMEEEEHMRRRCSRICFGNVNAQARMHKLMKE